MPLQNGLPRHHLRILDSDHTKLAGPFSSHQIIQSIKSFKPFKVPSPDNFHSFFFQKFQHNTLPTLQAYSIISSTQRVQSILNQTFISLIPKTNYLETINQFRPMFIIQLIKSLQRSLFPS